MVFFDTIRTLLNVVNQVPELLSLYSLQRQLTTVTIP